MPKAKFNPEWGFLRKSIWGSWLAAETAREAGHSRMVTRVFGNDDCSMPEAVEIGFDNASALIVGTRDGGGAEFTPPKMNWENWVQCHSAHYPGFYSEESWEAYRAACPGAGYAVIRYDEKEVFVLTRQIVVHATVEEAEKYWRENRQSDGQWYVWRLCDDKIASLNWDGVVDEWF